MDAKLDSLRVIRMQEVTEMVSLAPSTIYWLVQTGKFPAPFKITPGGRASGWLLGDVEGWLLSRADKGDAHE
jgi:prophage regulatory protein